LPFQPLKSPPYYSNTNALNEMLKPVQHDKKVCHSELVSESRILQ
jgi:hypothetical protein